MRLEVQEDREARTLTRRISLVRDGRRSEEVHMLRLYDPDDLVAWLDVAGFDVERGDGYGADGPRLPGVHAYVARRRA